MAPELHEKRGKNIINIIRRYNSRNSRVTLYKLIQKTHPTDIVGVASYFFIATTLFPT